MNFFLWSEASKDRCKLTMKQEPIQPFLFYSFLEFSQASVVLDIGANVGVYSLLSVLPESVSTVYAFEPDKAAYKELLKNIRLNAADRVVQVSDLAVSECEGVLRFGSHAPMAGVNAVIDSSIHDAEVFKEFSEVGCTSIDLMDGLKGQVLGLKIDVEGHEINVINGAKKTLENTPAFLQVEHYAGDDIDHVLSEMGYFRFFASGHDHYFTNIRNFANPEFVKRAVEHAGTCLVESQAGRWPEGKTVKDGLSISFECQNGKISASVVKDDRFFGDDAEYAFYLLENGKKVDEQWYTPTPHVEFPYGDEAETIEVKGFVREASFPEKKVAVGVFVKSSAVGYRANSAATDSLGAPSQYATLAARVTGGQLGYPDVEVSEARCLAQSSEFSGVLQLGAGLSAWGAEDSLGSYQVWPFTVILPQGQAGRAGGVEKASDSRGGQAGLSAELHYVNTPEQALDAVAKVAREVGGPLCVVLRDQFIFDLGEELSFLGQVLKLLPKGSSLYADGLVNTAHRQQVSSLADDVEMPIGWLYPKSIVLSSSESLNQEVMVSEDALYNHENLLSLNEDRNIYIKLHERVILEYGSKYVSTITRSTPERFAMCVETNRKIVRELIKKQNSYMSSAVIFHAKILDNLSTNSKNGKASLFESNPYISDIWKQPFFREPDLILLSGPMKSAAFMAVLKHIKRPTRLLFEGYIDEPEWHIIERVLPPVRVIGTWAEFSLLPGVALANESEILGANDESRE